MAVDDDSGEPELAELARMFAEVVGEARSEGGLVKVKVDHRGRVCEVWLDPQVADVPAEQLAAGLTTVCGAAFDNRLDQLAEIITEYDRDHGLTAGMRDYLQTSLGRLR